MVLPKAQGVRWCHSGGPSPSARLGMTISAPLLCHPARRKYTNMSRRHSVILASVLVLAALPAGAESPPYEVYVTNERSNDVTVIDGSTDAVVATFPVGKRPRGIHPAHDGKRIFVALSGSPRMAPGVETERAPADKAADGLGVIDPVARKLIDRWHAGSDPEEFAISKDGKFAFVANEDDASVVIVDLSSGQSRGKVKVSEEPEGMGVNPANGEVYVTCEEKGDVFAIAPGEQRVAGENRDRRTASLRRISPGRLARLRRLRERADPWP